MAVNDAEGKLVTAPVEVLRIWHDFVKALGKEDVITRDPGDRCFSRL